MKNWDGWWWRLHNNVKVLNAIVSQTVLLKMVKLAKFTSCVFVHNKVKNSKTWMFKLNHTPAAFIRLACPSLLGLSAWCSARLGASCGSPLRSRQVHGQGSGLPMHPSQHLTHVLLLAYMKKQDSVLKTRHSSEDTLLPGEVHYRRDVIRANDTQFSSAHFL